MARPRPTEAPAKPATVEEPAAPPPVPETVPAPQGADVVRGGLFEVVDRARAQREALGAEKAKVAALREALHSCLSFLERQAEQEGPSSPAAIAYRHGRAAFADNR